MPATVIAERIGWTNSISTLKNRVALIRPEYTSMDPADQLVHEPGQAAQMDLWFPEPRIPVGFGQSMMLPVLVMTLSYSRVLGALSVCPDPDDQDHSGPTEGPKNSKAK